MVKNLIKKIIGPANSAKLKKFYFYTVYKGSEFECPVCKNKLRRFLPGGFTIKVIEDLEIVGAGYYEDFICPVCISSNRDRLFYLYLQNRTDIFKKPLKLLHVAPEKTIQEKLKEIKTIDYISADLASPLADIKMDVTKIQYPDETFDVVLCNHVLEHVPDDLKAMSEIFRIIKNNGWAILQVPISYKLEKTYEDLNITDPKERESHFGQNDHVRIYGPDYIDRLTKSGFIVETIDPNSFLDKNEIQKCALINNEKIFLCKKIV